MSLDLTKIKDAVDEVISYSQNIPKPLETDDLINTWYNNKKRFIDAMDGKLIWESELPVSFDIPEVSRNGMVSTLADRFDSEYGNTRLADFVFEVREYFFSNIMPFDYTVDDIKVKKGSKIIKAFKHFERDKEKLVAMQNEASLLIQNVKVTGKFCLSVHPLDYLSSSENQYNWRSCHALDGEYRAGNLSYMDDKVTVVAYIKGEDDVILPSFPNTVPWNNKKWRMLLFISEDEELIFAGRQYPFSTDVALTLCKNMLSVIKLNPSRYSDWTDGKIANIGGKNFNLYENYLYINGYLYLQKEILQDAKKSTHFNDLIYSSYYEPKYIWKEKIFESGKPEYKQMTIGSCTRCVKCGEFPVASTETMLCNDCFNLYGEYMEDRCRCSECGEFDWIEDMVYITDEDRYVCESCSSDLVGYCEWCQGFYSKDKVMYDEKLGQYICESCNSGRAPLDITDSDFLI